MKLFHIVKNSKYPSKYSGKFCPEIGNTEVISVRYQLPFWFVCTFISVQYSSLETPHSGGPEYLLLWQKFLSSAPYVLERNDQFVLRPNQNYAMRRFVVCPNWFFSFMPPLYTTLLLSNLKFKQWELNNFLTENTSLLHYKV